LEEGLSSATEKKNATASAFNNASETVLCFGRMVRFTHTVFALPFALSGLALATTVAPFRWNVLIWVLVAMVAARSAAMGFNRIVDRDYDALNPRTAGREIPTGQVSFPAAVAFVAISSALFIFSAFMLNSLCGWLSLPALAVLFFYSLTKRFTWTSQFFLGLSLGISPIGAWLAHTGYLDWRVFVLAAAVLFWVAGFDIFYSCLDLDEDMKRGLFSVPRRWGIRAGIWIARLQHLATAALLISLFWLFPLGQAYLLGIALVVFILAVEDFLVGPDDMSRAMLAFNLNGTVSILYFFAVLAGLIWK
jgi:4-hydroxybenzoate polyprenyltransferase